MKTWKFIMLLLACFLVGAMIGLVWTRHDRHDSLGRPAAPKSQPDDDGGYETVDGYVIHSV